MANAQQIKFADLFNLRFIEKFELGNFRNKKLNLNLSLLILFKSVSEIISFKNTGKIVITK